MRIGLGLEQQDVANALGINAAVISRHENDRRHVGEEAVLRYAKFYGVTLDFLLDGPSMKTTSRKRSTVVGPAATRGDRLRQLREDRGFVKLAPTARMIGVNPVTMTHHEKGLREITRQAAELYARFFNVPAGFILFGDDLPGETLVDIVGQIEAGGNIRTMQTGEDVRRVAIPTGMSARQVNGAPRPTLVAFEVTCDSLYPTYFRGDVVIVARDQGPILPLSVNERECIVTTASGDVKLGIIRSEGEDYYSIIGPHAPPLFHVRLQSAAPVLQIHRGLLRNNYVAAD
ncbi:MAG TPA: helix-turn-helix domain-containing protein [Acetobacteraceae bacterium]|nr:helix-turn-helix domain-containing protein [Acetobacteraceae bacterium]